MSPLYLYGVTRPRRLPRRLSARGVSLVRFGNRAAIVSPVGSSPAESTKPNPLAHADVVEELHHGGVVLPARVGTLLPDRAAALELLAADETGRLLEAHRDNAELTSTKDIGPCPGITMFSSRGIPPSRKKESSQPGCSKTSDK